LTIFVTGLSYGLSVCFFSCAPLLLPILITNSSSLSSSLKIVTFFSLGRILTYTIISFLAYFVSLSLKNILKNSEVWQFLTGFMVIFLSFRIFYKTILKKEKHGNSCKINKRENSNFFILGFLFSFNLCAPVLTLVTFSASSSSPIVSLLYGLLFGIGAVMFSLLFYGFFISPIIKELLIQFTSYKKFIQLMASLLLFITGVSILAGNIKL